MSLGFVSELLNGEPSKQQAFVMVNPFFSSSALLFTRVRSRGKLRTLYEAVCDEIA